MNRDALVVGINQYPFLKDTPTSKAKHLVSAANNAEAIAQRLEEYGDFRVFGCYSQAKLNNEKLRRSHLN